MECKANRLAQTAKWLKIRPINGEISLGPHLNGKSKKTEPTMNTFAMNRIPHVGIIGAGISGLRCADVLLNCGFKVTILEAKDTIGGRTRQANVGGVAVDLGPNWIHGTQDNPIARISTASGTITHSWDGSQRIIDKHGHPLDEKTTTRTSDFMWTIIDKALEHSRKNSDQIPSSRSLFDYIKETVAESSLLESEKEACVEMSKLWGSYVGSPIDRQSLKFFFLEECLEGTNLFVASTYQNILRHIAAPALERAQVLLNKPVASIHATPRKPGVNHQVTAIADGKEYVFDEIVITCPLGWLKQNKLAFSPGLPQRLSQAIDGISYGQLEKVYVRFPTAFWQSHHYHETLSTKSADTKGTKTSGIHPGFTQFLSPTYVDHPPTPFWNQECLSLAALPEPCNHATLLFYLYGPCATQVISQIAPLNPDSQAYYDVLNTFLYPYYSRLPHYDGSDSACQPTVFLATQWQNDPWAGNGSYSNFQVGLEEGDRDIEVMREGMGVERGVWFAGEHTAPFVALGTTAGAYWSGEEVAGRICGLLLGGEVLGSGGLTNSKAK